MPTLSTRSDPVTVLHVDDSAADRYRRRRVLEPAGFQVREAASGAACEAALAVAWPEIVLLDVKLPDTHAFDLTRRIKALAAERHEHAAVVLISAYFCDSDSRVAGLESGADGYLIEPVSDAELVMTLRAVSRGQRERQESERELRAQAQALREADSAKTEFLAMVSHELRQPLHAARAALGVMKMRRDRAAGEKARDVLERQVEQMTAIVDDLLDATRVVRRQVALNAQLGDLREIVQAAIETTRASVTEREQRLAFIAPEVPVRVHADAGTAPTGLRQPALQCLALHAERGRHQCACRHVRGGRHGAGHRHGRRHRAGAPAAHLHPVQSRHDRGQRARYRPRGGSHARGTARRHD